MKFLQAAADVGLDGADLLFYPCALPNDILDAVKTWAHVLERLAPARPGHRKMMEAIVTSAGFQNLHHLQTLCKNLEARCAEKRERPLSVQIRGELLDPLAPALCLLMDPPAGAVLDRYERKGFESLSSLLAKVRPEIHPAVIRDAIAHRLASVSWDEVNSRSHFDAPDPLYEFVVDPTTGVGSFSRSASCKMIETDLKLSWQDYSQYHPDNYPGLREKILHALAKRPDFIEGHLVMALIEDHQQGPEAASVWTKQGMRLCELLMPRDFKGSVPWKNTENRCYLRLLYLHMRDCALFRRPPAAVAAARKLLNQAQYDALGVRFWMPLLHLIAGQTKLAEKELSKLDPRDMHTLLLRSVFRLFQTLDGGLEDLMLALLVSPSLREMFGTSITLTHQEQALFPSMDLRPIAYLFDLAESHLGLDLQGALPMLSKKSFLKAANECDAQRIRERKAELNLKPLEHSSWSALCREWATRLANEFALADFSTGNAKPRADRSLEVESPEPEKIFGFMEIAIRVPI